MGRMTLDKMPHSGPSWGGLYPAPPHFYRNTKNLILSYEVDPELVLDQLPEGVEPLNDHPRMVLWFQKSPFSTFGPHEAAYGYLECSFEGKAYMMETFLWVSSESAMAAGREFWGDSKKMGKVELDFVKEEVVASLERPEGSKIAGARMRLERFAEASELPAYPGLCLKYIPSAEKGKGPEVLQLVEDDFDGGPIVGTDGRAEIYAGSATVEFGPEGVLDPIASFKPLGPISAIYTEMNFELDYGTIVKDYNTPA
ncbi:acetoacetate decarboxylase family protein [Rhodococcus sp. JVH1]|uniref:acetoacetate decarboxylase family protein n=1 Tax=Rhodococcus sp. JVH1 TaxID=745408 RepID=UPI0002721838|nr:acetoacetate decarboxylase family protein [Rhodococcus sp. JVH1]EJI95809.1 acetoacetate decarboxylase family protein [Rhodococcus sp. JVH1]